MEDKDRVNMSLDKLIQLYDRIKFLEITLSELGTLILDSTDLNDKHNDLQVESYNLKRTRILEIIKSYMPNEYNTRMEFLLKENNE